MSKYSEQFKLEAITSYLAGGTSYRVAADKHEIEFGMLRRWVASGRLPAFRYGPRLIRVEPQEVDRLMCAVNPV